MFGSGHANLAMREAYRNDLAAVKGVTDMKYVRFHGILDDENGVYTEDEHGQPQYNFTYVDEIYDGLLARGVRPVVEISFMPKQLAAHPAPHAFWYKPNVAPPKDYARWDALIRALAENLVARYGIDEVAQWYFEVWNEPNIDFWVGEPKQATYFELYSHTARALKSVSPRLRVGGPAAAAEEWVPEFLKYMHDNNVPVDFLSTHGYADEDYVHIFTPSDTAAHGRSSLRRDGAREAADRRLAHAAHSLVRHRVERHRHRCCARHHLRRSCGGEHHSRMRRPRRHDVLLDLRRRL